MKTLGSKRYQVEYLEKVISDDIPNLTKTIRDQIRRAIEERLMLDPIGFGKPLRYSLKGFRRLRVGDYRIVYRIDGYNVIITAIKHRKKIYEEK